MAAIVSSGALMWGQWPVALRIIIVLPGVFSLTYLPTSSGAIISSEHCRVRLSTGTLERSFLLSDKNVTLAKSFAISLSYEQKSSVNSSFNSEPFFSLTN